MYRVLWMTGLIVSVALLGTSGAPAAAPQATTGKRSPDVVYVGTPHDIVAKMLELVSPKKDEVLYDPGCGDGRIVVMAAKKYGCKAVGIDLNPVRIREALANIERNGVGPLVKIERKDIFTVDFSEASVVTLYLLPWMNKKLIPQLEKLKPGSRIVAHDYSIEGITPDKTLTVTSKEDAVEHFLYVYSVPLKRVEAKDGDEQKEKKTDKAAQDK
jgi:SAM-dependent methyltransferase